MEIASAPFTRLEIERRANLSKKEFDRDYLMANRPVVVTDALKDWKAVGRWTPEFFREQFGERMVKIDGAERALGPFIEEVLASTPEHPAPYFRNEELAKVFPELMADIHPLPPYVLKNWLRQQFSPAEAAILTRMASPEFYLGGAGGSFPVVHYDYLHTHAFLMQLYGQKQYFVCSPDQNAGMYPVAGDPNRSQIADVEHPDLEKFPLFAQVKAYSLILNPGELLFVPCGWWHTVRMLTPSITISVNTANRANWKFLREDFCRIYAHGRRKTLQMGLYLRLVGLMSALAEVMG